jgi:hypothetical protein
VVKGRRNELRDSSRHSLPLVDRLSIRGRREATAAQAVAADLTGLEPGTTYHYRVVASNVHGAAQGANMSFTPAPRAPDPLQGVARPAGSGPRATVKCLPRRGEAQLTCRVTYRPAARKAVTMKLIRNGRVHARGTIRRAPRSGTVALRTQRAITAGAYKLTIRLAGRTQRLTLRLR